MQFTDRLTLDGAIRRTKDGYAVVSARVAKGGNVQLYRGDELGYPDRKVIRVYRPMDEVMKADALASYAGVPITFGHPKAGVTAENWKQVAVGEVGDEVLRDGEFVRVPMMIRDSLSITAVEAGICELSQGYEADLVIQDGVSPTGEAYDAFMKNYRMNHTAIVDKARGGEQLRIGDGAKSWGASPVHVADEEEPDMTGTLRTVAVDGIPVSTTEQAAAVIEKLLNDRQTAINAKADADRAHAEAIKAKDTELAAKDTEIGTLKADKKKLEDAALKPADLDKMVSDRANLVAIVKAVDGKIDVTGKTDADLRKAAVAAKLGDEMVKDASEAAIAGMFAAVTKDVKADPFVETVKDGIAPSSVADADVNAARAQMVKDMQSGTVSAKAN